MEASMPVVSLLLFLSSSLFAAAPPELEKHCRDFATPVPWAYCAWKTRGSRNPDILYHLHGRGLKEDAWHDEKPGELPYYPALVRERWREMGFEPPVVVTLTVSQPFMPTGTWLLLEKNASLYSGLLE